METLRASYSTAEKETGIRQSHELTVRLQGPIQVVSEKHAGREIVVTKDYFLHESEVYAMRVSYWAPCPDGKTARVSESRIFFDKRGPIYRGVVSTRVPASNRDPDLSKAKETSVPLPPGVENWGAKLKVRAFSIARSFRSHMGQYVFANWDQWLLKNAPAEDPGLTPPPRPAGWLPPKETRVLPIEGTDSPDGLFRVGWGYKEAPVDWARIADQPSDWGTTFSTKLAKGELKPPLTEDSNFLMNAITGEPISDIGHFHPGSRPRFNHDELLTYWSPTSRCFVARETDRWGDAQAAIGWIKDGKCDATHDILTPIQKAAEEAVKKSAHPAAKRMRSLGQDDEGYCFSVSQVLVDDDGTVETLVNAYIPKDPKPGSWFQAIFTGTFQPGSGESPAVLKNAKVKVLPARNFGESN